MKGEDVMLGSLFTPSAETLVTAGNLCVALLAALAPGALISLVYGHAHKDQPPSSSFRLTLVLLPAVVAVIILLVGSNVARAFSLAGAFSIIRFRSAPGDPKEITYVLLCMAVGLAAGMGYAVYAAVVAAVLCLVMYLLERTGFAGNRSCERLLKITVPENLDYEDAFADVMAKYAKDSALRRVRLSELGSLYELAYSVTLKPDASSKEFLDALRCRNGNLNITLVLAGNAPEF